MLLRFGPLVFWCSLIFYLSGIPYLSTGLGVWDLLLRKMAHVVEYAILAFLATRARIAGKNRSEMTTVLCAFVFSVLYAVSDEIHQSFVPGRGPSVKDVCIDSVGITIFCYIWLRKWKQSSHCLNRLNQSAIF